MFISGSLCVFCQQQSTFTRIGWFMHWQQGVALPLFTNFFGQKTEINHAVENLAKIWHHMWHWGHKCNCFGDLSLIVEGSQFVLWEFFWGILKSNVHIIQPHLCVLCLYLPVIVIVWCIHEYENTSCLPGPIRSAISQNLYCLFHSIVVNKELLPQH